MAPFVPVLEYLPIKFRIRRGHGEPQLLIIYGSYSRDVARRQKNRRMHVVGIRSVQ